MQTNGFAGIQVAAAAIVDNLARPTNLLSACRAYPEKLAGQWEFPGGKVEPGEDAQDALARELAEELHLTGTIGNEILPPVGAFWQTAPTVALQLWWFLPHPSSVPSLTENHLELRWLHFDELLSVPWIPGNLQIVESIMKNRPTALGRRGV